MLTRKRLPEKMDHSALDHAAHKQAREDLARLNSFASVRDMFLMHLYTLMQSQNMPSLRVLDLATGSGEEAIQIWAHAHERGKDIQIAGCDISNDAISMAQENASKAGAPIEFFRADVLKDTLPEDYDVIITSLFTHHLSDDEVVELLRRMKSAARKMIVISDLERSVINYGLVWLGTRLLTSSPIVHFDGPASVLNAFTKDELLRLAERAGLDGAKIFITPPCRMLLVWKK